MITDAYLEVLTKSRAQNPYWGAGGARHAPRVIQLLEVMGISTGAILDYGSGVGTFGEAVRERCGRRYDVCNYEPTLPQWRELEPGPFEAVVCTHVLEHIEPELLVATLDEIKYRATRLIYLEIPHREAKETLADGRNAHLIVEPATYWRARLDECFPHALIAERPSMLKTQTQFEIMVWGGGKDRDAKQ